jgi:hypothetical protein
MPTTVHGSIARSNGAFRVVADALFSFYLMRYMSVFTSVPINAQMVRELGLVTCYVYGELLRSYHPSDDEIKKGGYYEYPISLMEYHTGVPERKILKAIITLDAFGFISAKLVKNKEFSFRLTQKKQDAFRAFMETFNDLLNDN